MKAIQLTGRDSDNGVSNRLAEISLSSLLHLTQNHSRNLLRCEFAVLSTVLDLNGGLVVLRNNLKWPTSKLEN